MPNKKHLRKVLSSIAVRMLRWIYFIIITYEFWFWCFKYGDFTTEDKERPDQVKKLEMETILDEDSCQTQEEQQLQSA